MKAAVKAAATAAVGDDDDPEAWQSISNPLLCFPHLQEADVVTSTCRVGSFAHGLSRLTALQSLAIQVHSFAELDQVSSASSLTSLHLLPRMAAAPALPRALASHLFRLSSLHSLTLQDLTLQDLSAVLSGASQQANRRLPLLTRLDVVSSSPYATLNLQAAIAQSIGSLTRLQELSLDPALDAQSLLSLRRLAALTRLTLGCNITSTHYKRFDLNMARAVGRALASLQCLEVTGEWSVLHEKGLREVVRLLPGLKQLVLPADSYVSHQMMAAAGQSKITLKYPTHAQDE